MTIAVVPVKELGAAKGRLSARLAPRERRELVLAMLEDVLTALSETRGLSGVIVVSREPEIASMASRFRAEVLEEPIHPGDGYTHAVEHAIKELDRRGEPAVLTVPGDVPAVTPREIAQILGAVADTAVVLVPSRDERGTNAALIRPPGALPLRFGEPSFARHLERARELGLSAEVLRLPGLSLDLDTPADLDEFLRTPSPTRTYRLLSGQIRPMNIELIGIEGLPEVVRGNDVAQLIAAAASGKNAIRTGDLVVVTQKIVSKAEGQLVRLADVAPSPFAHQWASRYRCDPRVVELVLRESRRIVRMDRGVLIVETHHGFVCANAGVDLSNVDGGETATLLPKDPDASAQQIREGLIARTQCKVGVIISDTFGRPWREGLVNIAIGAAGISPLRSHVGTRDPQGFPLQATIASLADEAAAAAGLVSGKLNRIPVVLVRGLEYDGSGSARELLRTPEGDLFR